jgi:bacillithiol system protein YtxJ
MAWIVLSKAEEVEAIKAKSFEKPQCIFKHSTRCSISGIAKNRIEAQLSTLSVQADLYYLDLLSYRSISNLVSEIFKVPHESPQLLLIKNGECVFEESHLGIQSEEIRLQIQQA